MKIKKLITLAATGSVLGAATSALAVGGGSATLTLADAGDGQTTISWVLAGAFTSYGVSVTTPGFSGLDPQFTGWINELGAYTDPLAVSGFGTFSNSSNEGTATLASVQLVPYADTTYSLQLTTDTTLSDGANDVAVFYAPAADSATIDVPFSTFNPGTYHYSTPYNTGTFVTAMNYTLDVLEPAPEPSTLALAGLALFGMIASQRRRK